jgi:hypothetical protein
VLNGFQEFAKWIKANFVTLLHPLIYSPPLQIRNAWTKRGFISLSWASKREKEKGRRRREGGRGREGEISAFP